MGDVGGDIEQERTIALFEPGLEKAEGGIGGTGGGGKEGFGVGGGEREPDRRD